MVNSPVSHLSEAFCVHSVYLEKGTHVCILFRRKMYELLFHFQDHHEEDYFLYIAFSDENVYGGNWLWKVGGGVKN